MSWRGSTTPLDRVFACLPYLFPLIEGLGYGKFLFAQFPTLSIFLVPLVPVLKIYYINKYMGLIIFIVLFLAVVRNEKINRFIRFNTFQAILFDIVLLLCSMAMRILRPALNGSLLIEVLFNIIFIGLLAVLGYSIVNSVMGRYAEIPGISEAVYTQLP